MIISSTHDYRTAAQKRLPPFLFHYADGGAGSEQTLHRNRSGLQNIVLRQRVLQEVKTIDVSTSLFGQELTLPLALGLVGIAGMYLSLIHI